MRDRNIFVTSRFFGNGSVNFSTVLPILGAPWTSMGNVELLTNIGQLLDELPASGSDAPEWGTAMKIVTDHYDYVRRCGQRLPGTILAAPFYSGRHGKWGFKVELCDGLNLAKLDLCVGPEDDTCARKARLSNNDDSDRAANSVGEIGEGLKKAGIVFNA